MTVFSIINIIFKMPIFSILISVIDEYIYSIVFKCTLQKNINNNTSQGKKVLIIQPDTYIHLLTHTSNDTHTTKINKKTD